MRRLALLLTVSGLLLVASGLAYGAFQRAIAAPGSAPLPPSLAELRLLEKLSGPAATENITRLHRKAFPLSGAAVGTYGNGTHSATVWVSRSPLTPLAARMERAMEQAIAEGQSPFTAEETRRLDGRPVRVLSGMGQTHYYFRSDDLVIWLAVDEATAEVALADALAFYR